MEIDIPKSLAKKITLEYLADLTPGQLDTIFADQISEFFEPKKLFKKVKSVLNENMKIS